MENLLNILTDYDNVLSFKKAISLPCDFKGELCALLGVKDDKPIYADVTNMPNLLVGGQSGAGKSIFINTFLSSLLLKYDANYVKFMLCDLKRVEFACYENIPHLYGGKIYTDFNNVFETLNGLVEEMEQRYSIFSENNVRNIVDYNKVSQNKLPYIVVVIDEVADLFLTRKKEVENIFTALSQKCRAVGIHLVVTTQRPFSMITNIRANFPTRCAFKVPTFSDSLCLIGRAGLVDLMRGEFIYQSPLNYEGKIVKCPYISYKEVVKFNNYVIEKYSK